MSREPQVSYPHFAPPPVGTTGAADEQSQVRADSLLARWREAVLVAFCAALFIGVDLGSLEFFRHTEADRSLISWEMLETQQFLVPRLLGSQILTKPPLFYWLQVASFEIFSEVNEFSARVPSLVTAAISCALLYLTVLALAFPKTQALFFVAVLLTSSQFFLLARVAEIDMAYGFFSWAALTMLFFAEVGEKQGLRCLSYFCLGLAGITKGPPTLVIFAGALVLLRLVVLRRPIAWGWTRQHAIAACAFLLPVGIWLALLSHAVGWDALVLEFQTEILARTWEPSERNRGVLFYPTGMLLMMLPWSALLVVGLLATRGSAFRPWQGAITTPWRADAALHHDFSRQRAFSRYAAAVVGLAVVALSIAEGKSLRYLFPVHFFLAYLVALLLLHLVQQNSARRFALRPALIVCAVALLAQMVVLVALHQLLQEEVPRSMLLVLGVCMMAATACAYWAAKSGIRRAAIASGALFLLTLRIGYSAIYIPHRNAHRSVIALATQLNAAVPQDAQLFTLEMFERWVLFYLKQQGRNTLRVDPAMAKSFANHRGQLYLLLNETEESWRVAELRHFDPETSVVARIDESREPLLLVRTAADVLQNLELQERFPTEPTVPKLSESSAIEQR